MSKEKKCPKCGALLAAGSAFCTECGAKIDSLESYLNDPVFDEFFTKHINGCPPEIAKVIDGALGEISSCDYVPRNKKVHYTQQKDVVSQIDYFSALLYLLNITYENFDKSETERDLRFLPFFMHILLTTEHIIDFDVIRKSKIKLETVILFVANLKKSPELLNSFIGDFILCCRGSGVQGKFIEVLKFLTSISGISGSTLVELLFWTKLILKQDVDLKNLETSSISTICFVIDEHRKKKTSVYSIDSCRISGIELLNNGSDDFSNIFGDIFGDMWGGNGIEKAKKNTRMDTSSIFTGFIHQLNNEIVKINTGKDTSSDDESFESNDIHFSLSTEIKDFSGFNTETAKIFIDNPSNLIYKTNIEKIREGLVVSSGGCEIVISIKSDQFESLLFVHKAHPFYEQIYEKIDIDEIKQKYNPSDNKVVFTILGFFLRQPSGFDYWEML